MQFVNCVSSTAQTKKIKDTSIAALTQDSHDALMAGVHCDDRGQSQGQFNERDRKRVCKRVSKKQGTKHLHCVTQLDSRCPNGKLTRSSEFLLSCLDFLLRKTKRRDEE